MHRTEFRRIDNPHGYDLPEFVASSLAYTIPNPCLLPDEDVLACEGSSVYVTTLAFDTTAADPTVTATIIDLEGTPQASWTVALSELSFP